MLPIINSVIVQHEKDIWDIISRGKCPVCVSNLFISDDPTGRLGINLIDQRRQHLLLNGPHGPMLNSNPVNPSISVHKPICFTKSWYNINLFIEYSQNLDKVFCFLCSLFGSKISYCKNMW